MTTVKTNFTFLTPAEEKQLLSVVTDKRDLALIKTFLDTGVMMKELQNLMLSDLDLAKKLLTVTVSYTNPSNPAAKAARTIPLNDELVAILTSYLTDRPASPVTNIFITNRGKLSPLSHWAVEDILHKYQLKGNLAKRVNAHNLRNTFAVKLCLYDLPFDKLSAILGLSNGDSIQRYVTAARQLKEHKLEGALDVLDKRSGWQKFISGIFTEHTPPSLVQETVAPLPSEPEELVGRETLLRNIQRDLQNKMSVLLVGELGSGKTALIKKIVPDIDFQNQPLKAILFSVVLKYNADISKTASLGALLSAIPQEAVIPLSRIDRLRKDNLALIQSSFKTHTFLLSAESITPAILYLKNMAELYRLDKLSDEEIRTIVQRRLPRLHLKESQQQPVINKVVSLANGNPGLADILLMKLEHHERLTDGYLRQLYAALPGNERDWSIMLVLLFSVLLALRYISRGTGDTELYLLSGISYSFFIFVKNIKRSRR